MAAAIPASNRFYYTILPSAFKIIEFPVWACWRAFRRQSEELWQKAKDGEKVLKNRTLAIILNTGSFVGGMVVTPLMLCATPVTALADIIIGVAEIAFCYSRGVPREELRTIAHRKILVSPCQHLTFCLAAIGGFALGGILIVSTTALLTKSFGLVLLCLTGLGAKFNTKFLPLLKIAAKLSHFPANLSRKQYLCLFSAGWTVAYAFGQAAVGFLPKNINHNSFNIFVNGGSGEADFDGPAFRWAAHSDLSPELDFSPPPQSSQTAQSWETFLNNQLGRLCQLTDSGVLPLYQELKNRVSRRASPAELLTLPNMSYDQAYRRFALAVHPDRNAPRQEEATALMQILTVARRLVIAV